MRLAPAKKPSPHVPLGVPEIELRDDRRARGLPDGTALELTCSVDNRLSRPTDLNPRYRSSLPFMVMSTRHRALLGSLILAGLTMMACSSAGPGAGPPSRAAPLA